MSRKTQETRRHFIGAAVLLTLLGAASYWDSLSNTFVFDDRTLVIENPALRRPDGLLRTLDIVRKTHESYRPVRNLSYIADHFFYGFNPVGYRISNVLCHATVCVAVYSGGILIGMSAPAALAGAMIFAVHPLNTECVAYISGRRDLLCAFFYLASLLCFLRYRRTGSAAAACGCAAGFILSLLSKEMGITLPAVVLGIEILMPGHPPARKRMPLHALLWAITAADLYYSLYYRPPSTHPGFYGGSMLLNFMTSARIMIYYAGLTLFPVLLNADYSGFPVSVAPLCPAGILALLGVAAVLTLSALAALKGKKWPLPILWSALTLMPVLQIIPHHDLMAEHFLYLPLVGAALGAGAVLERIARRRGRVWRHALLGTLVLIFALRTAKRNMDWKDPLTFWRTTAEKTSFPCARAYAGLGIEYRRIGDLRKAEACLRKALGLDPGDPRAATSLAGLLGNTGRAGEAERVLLEATAHEPQSFSIRLKLAQFYADQGLTDAAANIIMGIARDFPDSPDTMYALGQLAAAKGRWNQAASWYEKALAIQEDPDYAASLAEAQAHEGKIHEAIRTAETALSIDSENRKAHVLLANLLLNLTPPDIEAAAGHIQAAEKGGLPVPEALQKRLAAIRAEQHKARGDGTR